MPGTRPEFQEDEQVLPDQSMPAQSAPRSEFQSTPRQGMNV
jgi:hypothetical protein